MVSQKFGISEVWFGVERFEDFGRLWVWARAFRLDFAGARRVDSCRRNPCYCKKLLV